MQGYLYAMADDPDPASEPPALHLLPEDDDQAVVEALRAAGGLAAQHDRVGGDSNEDFGSLPASGPAGEGRYENRVSVLVIPTLFLRSAPPGVSGPWTYAQTAEEAVTAIDAGLRPASRQHL